MVAASQHAAQRRIKRRHSLANKVTELENQLKAAGGETRKGMRERLARTTAELAELKTNAVPKKELVTAQNEVSRLSAEIANLTQMNENLMQEMVAHGYDREAAKWKESEVTAKAEST